MCAFYVAVHCSLCVCLCVCVSVTVCIRYDEMFRFWGNDKVSHVMELVAHGFQFVVLPNSMVVHIPHSYELPDQDSVRSFTSCSSLRVCVCVMCA
jgi:Glycosyl-transferase for dystroglycan